jgi:hypothetical protein
VVQLFNIARRTIPLFNGFVAYNLKNALLLCITPGARVTFGGRNDSQIKSIGSERKSIQVISEISKDNFISFST